MKRFPFFICVILATGVLSQTPGSSSEDFPIEQYFEIILANHPIAKQAGLLSETAQQEIRMAKGAFDPKIEAFLDSKEFQDKSYYNKLDGYLSVPTRSPITPKIGFEQNRGELLNAIDRIPGDRQFIAGVSIPLGRGLITDERRTALKQAELLKSFNEADQVKIINKLLLEASKKYWNWYYAFEATQFAFKSLSLTKDILERVKVNYRLGEASILDTIQAKITWQSRQIELQELELLLKNSLINVSNYMWDEDQNPIQIENYVRPVTPIDLRTFTEAEVNYLIERARTNHPELNKLQIKAQQYSLEKKLAQEFLKPQLNVNYGLLSQPGTIHVFDPINDYKLGVDFSFPIFLRKERGKIGLTNIKIRNLDLETNLQEREIVNATWTAINEVNTQARLIEQQQQMVSYYERIMEGELLNLKNGESDLFKINVQQEKLIQSQLKALKLISELAKQKYYVLWAAGVKDLVLN